jgi:hypothetical protein
MTYRPAFVRQGDGSPAQWDNCAAATGAMNLDRDTRGVLRTTGARVRQLTGQSYGGLTLAQIDAALLKGFGPRDHLDVRPKISFVDAMTHLRAGQGAELFYSYRPLVGTRFDCWSGRFAGIHASWMNELSPDGTLIYWGDPGADGRRADVPKGFQWIPVSLVRQAAGLYAGAGYAQLGFSRDTEPAYRARIKAGSKFLHYYVRDGRIIGHVVNRTPNGFSARCRAPRLYRWDSRHPTLSPRSLVKLTSGSREGWYIGAQYAHPIAGTGG